jgi:hypothetical protein
MRDISLLQPARPSCVHIHWVAILAIDTLHTLDQRPVREEGDWLQHLDQFVADGILNIHQPHHAASELSCGCILNGLQLLAGDAHWRNYASRIAE